MTPPSSRTTTCQRCGALLWRLAEQQKEANRVPAGTLIPLWPDPSSVYTQEQVSPDAYTVAIGWCQACAPEIGEPGALGPVIGHEAARDRYESTFRRSYGAWLRVHLTDQIGYDEVSAEDIWRRWEREAA